MSNRIFYACHAVEINDTTISGAQSVALNTNFNLEQVFELGQLAIYENVSTDPDVELTVSKVIDGYITIFNHFLAGANNITPVTNSIRVDAPDARRRVCLVVGDETQEAIGDNGVNTVSICMSGMYLNSINYTFPVDGNFTEEAVFVGSARTLVFNNDINSPHTDPNDHVLRRQNFRLHDTSTLPTHVRGRNLSNCTISANLNREKMFRLGQHSPFHRFVNFPVEITVTFDVIAQDGNDRVTDFGEVVEPCIGVSNSPEPIVIILCRQEDSPLSGINAYKFDLGNKAYLQTVAYSGGDTGGGNVTITYTYQVFNSLTITYDELGEIIPQ